MPFFALGLSPDLLRAVESLGHSAPTAIQTAAIPAALKRQDVLATAPTGSGKTLAFALPLLQLLSQSQLLEVPQHRRQAQVLILVPTRELAAQVGETLISLTLHLPARPRISVVFGGVSINPQMMALRGGTDVLVATTGRLLDLIDHNALSINSVRALVLDEADRMLDLGFSEELSRILSLLPAHRQNLFFSATFPKAVQLLAQTLLNNPVRVEVIAKGQTALDITQRAICVDTGRRTQLLRHLITSLGWTRVLVFVATKHAAEIVADKLRKAGIDAEPFHGLLSQGKRTQVLQDFKASRITAVIATDIAARGLDVSQLPVVVNYDLPRSAVDYTHRIGRTGRATEAGLAVSFVTADTEAHFQLIEKRQHKSIARETISGFEPAQLATPMSASEPGGGIKGKRPSKKDKLRAAHAEAHR